MSPIGWLQDRIPQDSLLDFMMPGLFFLVTFALYIGVIAGVLLAIQWAFR